MLVTIIILNYNGKEYLKGCLDSVVRLNFPRNQYEVIVVHNPSDNSWKIAEKYKNKGIKLIKNRKNLGFAEGNNIGMKKAKGKYIVLFNNDLIVDKNWLKELVPIMEENKDIGAIGGKIYLGKTDVIWYGGARIYFGGFVNHKYLKNKEGEVDYIVGAAVMYRKSVLDKVGLFDKKFFLYGEDTDLGFRIRKAGYKIYYNPKAISYHMLKKKRASSAQEYYEQRNRVYFYSKNYKKIKYIFLILDFFIFFPLFWFNRILKNPNKLRFFKETLKARIDSLKMSLKY